MLHKTQGIVLRSVKYGESSLITTIFTSVFGVQSYMVRGARSTRSRLNKAASFQPGSLLDLVVYHYSQKNLQSISQHQPAYVYTCFQEDVMRNSIVIFSVEVLLRLLPAEAPMPDLFDFALGYFKELDKLPVAAIANFPLYFIIHCSRDLGFELRGAYSSHTPYLDMQEGEFTDKPPAIASTINDEDAAALSSILKAGSYDALSMIPLNGATRLRLIDWYIAFLQQHTQHMGHIRSLPVLRVVLHQ